jgi:acyl-CoA thioester hydrolase
MTEEGRQKTGDRRRKPDERINPHPNHSTCLPTIVRQVIQSIQSIQSIQMIPKHQIELTVRDYECDLQGIVNNAVYLNYLEHARHTYLLDRNIDFAQLHIEGVDLVVHRIEIDYKQSLTSGDRFQITSSMRKEGHLRVIFDQEIVRLPDMKPVVKAKVTGVGVRNGRPMRVSDIVGFQDLD